MKKAINLSLLSLICLAAGAVCAQQQKLEMRATVTRKAPPERIELTDNNLENLKPLMFYLKAFLQAGNLSGKYSLEDAFLAYVAATEMTETPDLESLYKGEEFLNLMEGIYTENSPYPFPEHWTPVLVANMLNQLPRVHASNNNTTQETEAKPEKDPLRHYARVFLNTAIATGHLSSSIKTKEVKDAFKEARAVEMDFTEEELVEAEELLQAIRNSHQFPLEFDTVFVAKVLNILR